MKYKRLQMSKPIPVMLDRKLLQRIDALSGRIGEAKSTVMRMAMRVGLDRLEKAFEAGVPASLLSPEGEEEGKGYPPHRPEYITAEDAALSSAAQAVEREAVRAVKKFARSARPPKADPTAGPTRPK